jgi:hypothetical protein
VPYPRGFAFGRDGRLFLGSGIGPNGEGDDTIVAFAPTEPIQASRLVTDPELSPLETHSGGGPGRETATRAVFFTPRRQFME